MHCKSLLYRVHNYGQMCLLYKGFGSIGFVTLVQPFRFSHYRMYVISWCGLLEVRLDRTTNVTYDMLYNGWGIGIVL
jgi:hypothetical protein